MYCPSCGSEYRDEVPECVDCRVPLVQEPPASARRRRIAIFPPRTSNRPFLLEFLGAGLTLAGTWATLNAIILLAKMSFSDGGPGFGLRIGEALFAFVWGGAALSVAYAIWRERAWSRPALIAFLLLVAVTQKWLESADVASGALSLLPFALAFWYLYLWPNTTDYYRRVREAGRGQPMPS